MQRILLQPSFTPVICDRRIKFKYILNFKKKNKAILIGFDYSIITEAQGKDLKTAFMNIVGP